MYGGYPVVKLHLRGNYPHTYGELSIHTPGWDGWFSCGFSASTRPEIFSFTCMLDMVRSRSTTTAPWGRVFGTTVNSVSQFWLVSPENGGGWGSVVEVSVDDAGDSGVQFGVADRGGGVFVWGWVTVIPGDEGEFWVQGAPFFQEGLFGPYP